MIFKLFSELLHERNHRHGGGIAERTERASQHVLRKVLHVVDVFLHAPSVVEADQGFLKPVGSFAARDAPTTALVLIELHRAQRKFHYAGALIENDYAAGAKHRSSLHYGVEIHGDVDLVFEQYRS